MKKLLLPSLFLAFLLSSAMAAGLHPFVRGSWVQLLKAHKGEPIVVHFWGLTCGPCLAELPAWNAFRKSHPNLKLVLVDSSPFGDDPAQTEAALKKSGLENVENWIFADSFEEKLRYEIDPHWHGEMPYTLLIGSDGKPKPIIGVMNFKDLNGWLAQNGKKGSLP